MDNILELFEKISQITFDIKVAYSKLTLLEVSKDIEVNYNEDKKKLLDYLSIRLKDEEEAYEVFNSNEEALYALEKIYKYENSKVPETYYLCQQRIKNKLKELVYKYGIEEQSDDFIESYLEDEFFTYLLFDRNFSDEEMYTFIKDVLPILNYSTDRHFLHNINNDINNPDNLDIRRLLINKKLDWLFEHNGIIEKEALEHGFDNYNISLSEDTKMPINDDLKHDLINFEVKNKIYDNLVNLGAVDDIELVLPELEWVKTYLLYLNDKEIQELKDYVVNYNFQDRSIKDRVINIINNNKNNILEHNSTSYQK